MWPCCTQKPVTTLFDFFCVVAVLAVVQLRDALLCLMLIALRSFCLLVPRSRCLLACNFAPNTPLGRRHVAMTTGGIQGESAGNSGGIRMPKKGIQKFRCKNTSRLCVFPTQNSAPSFPFIKLKGRKGCAARENTA